MNVRTVLGQKSLRIATDQVEAWVTELGGHIAPITFHLPSGDVEPMSVAPWAEEDHVLPAILKVLRGDFFCMPFGGNDAQFDGEQHPIHGETANSVWNLDELGPTTIRMSLDTLVRKGHVEKTISLLPGQMAIYQRHVISGMQGPMCLGHHAMVRFRSVGYLSVAPFDFGQVFPGQFEAPALGGYSSLKAGARFGTLSAVPATDGTMADLSKYPAREGFEDLVMVYSNPEATFGWTAVHFPDEGFVWFSLKDPRVLSGTVLWHSNGGRHYAPWSGRHRAVLGLEEVTSSFHWGLAGSVSESEAKIAGYRTYVELKEDEPLVVNTIIGVAPSKGLSGPIAKVEPFSDGIRLFDAVGGINDVQLDVGHLFSS